MARNLRTVVALAILAGLTAPAPVAAGQDWPQWRGPNRDGAVTSFSEPASWPEGLTEHWTVEVGLGYATPLLVGERIYMYTRQNEDEVMIALDARSGEIIWRTSYPAPFDMSPATERHRGGPKSTPTFADGRLFTLGDKRHRHGLRRRDRETALAETCSAGGATLPYRDVSGRRGRPHDRSRRRARRRSAHGL